MTITINHHLDEMRLYAGAVEESTDLDPEVPERARGPRRFPAAHKARILAEYDTLGKADEGALLRREGLYSSLLTEWHRQRDRGRRGGPRPDQRSSERRPPGPRDRPAEETYRASRG